MDFINLPLDVVLHKIFLFVPKYDLRLTNKDYWNEGYKVKLSTWFEVEVSPLKTKVVVLCKFP